MFYYSLDCNTHIYVYTLVVLDCPLSPYTYEPVAYQSLHAAPCSCSSKHYRRMEWALRISPAI